MLGSPDGVREMTVAAVNKDVSFFKMRGNHFDKIINRLTGFDHQHNFTGLGEICTEFLDRMTADNIFIFTASVNKIIDFFHRARARFLELAENDPSVAIIDASQSLEVVTADITRALQSWLEQN